MGYLTIPLDSVGVNTQSDKWYPVRPRKSKDKVSGEIHIYAMCAVNKVRNVGNNCGDNISW